VAVSSETDPVDRSVSRIVEVLKERGYLLPRQ
jgi:hypothetical protein